MANKITRKGLNNLLNAGYLNDVNVPTKISIGIDTTSPLVSNTSLGKKIPINSTEEIDNFETADWVDGTDTESALNSALFKIGSNSLSVAKTGTTGTTMSINKATTSADFTDKDLWVWVYLEDKTDLVSSGTALSIKFGSDSSNYYNKEIDITDLSNGWNAITFDSSVTSVGSPVITAIDYTEFIFNFDDASDTIVADRVLIDDLKLADSDSYYKEFDVNYPQVDEVSSEVEVQTTLTTTDAVGYPLTETGILTNDNDLLVHSVSFADNKTNKEIFIEVNRIKLLNSF